MNKFPHTFIRCVATAWKTARLMALGVCLSVLATGCGHADKQPSASKRAATDNDVQAVTSASPEAAKNSPAEILAKQEVPILCYHRISPTAKGAYAVTPATFEGHIKVLSDSGYHVISPKTTVRLLVVQQGLAR